MDHTERLMLIRRGNELFSNKDYKNALKIYMAISDFDGIGKIAGVLEKEKKDRVAALKLYKHAGMTENVDRLAYEIAQTIRFLITEDLRKTAQDSGKNFNTGFKISGQAPQQIPHETILNPKEKSGFPPTKTNIFPAEYDKRIIRWRPMSLSQNDLKRINKKK
ncbi:MAG: hypothetical protein ACRCV0_03825 [Brevinema sp.]